MRGEALWNLGRKDEAATDFRKVVELAPKGSEQYQLAASRLGMTTAQPAKRRRAAR